MTERHCEIVLFQFSVISLRIERWKMNTNFYSLFLLKLLKQKKGSENVTQFILIEGKMEHTHLKKYVCLGSLSRRSNDQLPKSFILRAVLILSSSSHLELFTAYMYNFINMEHLHSSFTESLHLSCLV